MEAIPQNSQETSQPEPEAQSAPTPENDSPIKFSMEISDEAPKDWVDTPAEPMPENARQRFEREAHEAAEAKKKKFYDAVMNARKPETKPIVKQPVAPAVTKQTELEIAAGRAAVAKHEAQRTLAARLPKKGVETPAPNNIPVFRPRDYVPDPKKGTGQVVVTGL